MRLRLGEILKENARKGKNPSTAYALAKASGGRLSMSTAARLARDEWQCLTRDVLSTLCEVLDVWPDDLLDLGSGESRGKVKRGGRA